jgi:hypothetical protein
LRTAGIIDIQTKTGMLDPGGNFTLYGGQQSTFQPSAEYGGACQPEPVFQERSNQAGAAGLLVADGLTAMLLLRFSGSNTHASDYTSCIPSRSVFITPADYAGAAAAASGIACHEGVRAGERARSSASLKIVWPSSASMRKLKKPPAAITASAAARAFSNVGANCFTGTTLSLSGVNAWS